MRDLLGGSGGGARDCGSWNSCAPGLLGQRMRRPLQSHAAVRKSSRICALQHAPLRKRDRSGTLRARLRRPSSRLFTLAKRWLSHAKHLHASRRPSLAARSNLFAGACPCSSPPDAVRRYAPWPPSPLVWLRHAPGRLLAARRRWERHAETSLRICGVTYVRAASYAAIVMDASTGEVLYDEARRLARATRRRSPRS